jgi:hypothetical protein
VSDHHQHGRGEALPAELQRMHHRLRDDGATWRAEFPSSDRFREDVEAFRRASAAQAPTPDIPQHSIRERDPMYIATRPLASPDGLAHRRLRHRYLRGLAAVAAIMTVAALFAVAFQMLSVNRPSQTNKPTGSPTLATQAGVWMNVGQFQANSGVGVKVAPSDPYVVYRINHRSFAMERSVEGGATWQTVTLPSEVVQSPLKTYAVIDVSPLAANTVYLTAFGDNSSPSCPSPFLPGGQLRPNYTCSLQYVSTDGGAHWQRLMLPAKGQLTGMLTQYLGIPWAPLLAQENRIYSLMTLDAFAGSYRLVVSGDGVTWQTADDALAATGLRIASYIASPTGSSIWATLSDGSLWRGDDAGKRWARAADLPQSTELVAARIVAGKNTLYAATGSPPLGDIAPTGVRVSTDDGKTWQPAPARGVPDGQHAAPHSAMTRSDGALIMLFRTAEVSFAFDEGILHDAAYYAWTPGAKSWTRLTPTFNAEAVEQQWTTPANGAKPLETIWALIYRDDNLTYDGETYIKDGIYTITGCGLGS